MDVEVAHFLDAGEKDADGLYDYYYEGDNFTFSEPEEQPLFARVYADEPTVASFGRLSCRQVAVHPLSRQAAEYLATRGVTTLRAFGPSGGYETWIPADR